MTIKLRDLRKYRWTSDFKRTMWEALKKSPVATFPDWTYEQLQYNGWAVRVPDRFKVDLYHRDGQVVQFTIFINGQEMPHISAIWCYMNGLPRYNGFTLPEMDIIYREITEKLPRVEVTRNASGTRITINNSSGTPGDSPAYWGQISPALNPPPAGELSSEKFVYNIMGIDVRPYRLFYIN